MSKTASVKLNKVPSPKIEIVRCRRCGYTDELSQCCDGDRTVFQIDFQKIREAAKATGLSTRAIARKAGGITHSTVFTLLSSEEANPTAINLKKICDVIGVPIEEALISKKAA